MNEVLFLVFLALVIFEIAAAVSWVAVSGLILKEVEKGNDHIQIRLPQGYMPKMLFNRHPVITSFFQKPGAFGFFVQLGSSGFWSSMTALLLALDLGKVAVIVCAVLLVCTALLYHVMRGFTKMLAGVTSTVVMKRGP